MRQPLAVGSRQSAVKAAAIAIGGGLLLSLALSSPGDVQAKAKQPAGDAGQDFVFLAEARPILVRVHVRIDGKTLSAAYDEFIMHLFRHLDVKGKGYLGAAEVERAPQLSHIASGGLGSLFGGFGMGGADGGPTLKDFDAKNGKIFPADLAAYYRKKGLTPIQVQAETDGGNRNMMMMIGGGSTEPTVDAVNGVIFALLDARGTGALTKTELAATAERLLKFDANEDEIITVGELVPPTPVKAGAAMDGMFRGAAEVTPLAGPGSRLMLVPTPGVAPADLVAQMQIRYGLNEGNGTDLTRKGLGLDEATFKLLDTNGDGVLDPKEQAAFVKRAPDLEIMVRLAGSNDDQRGVELIKQKGKSALLAAKASMFDGLGMLELGKTRVEFRGHDDIAADQFAGLLRAQMTAFFKQTDKDNDGYLDAGEVKNGPFGNMFASAFKAMDRNGDGKVSEKEFNDYLDFLADLQIRAKRACVSLVLTDESRGLFDLLDTNRDGRLSVREMRAAPALLNKLTLRKSGEIKREDLPRSYRLTLRRGPASASGEDYSALIARIYGGGGKSVAYRTPTKGPEWFRKMDKNRDGDVSRKEWLGTEEMFRRIDTDGDGLISADEADRFDALHRKRK